MERNQKRPKNAVKVDRYAVSMFPLRHYYLSKKAQAPDRNILMVDAKIAVI